MSTLAFRIANRRKELQMTQEELAKKLGYRTKSTISRIESGDNDIPLNKVDAFAAALETTRAYIMGWEDKPAAAPYNYNPGSSDFSDFSDAVGRNRMAVNSVMDIVNQYGTDTPEQRAALSAALDAVDIPADKRELIQRILRMEPEQVAAFLAMAQQMPQ